MADREQLTLGIAAPPRADTAARVYYEDEFATLWCGDCREVLAASGRREFDLLATDPPYGIEYRSGYGDNHEPIVGDDGSLDVLAVVADAVCKLRSNRHAYVFGYKADDLSRAPNITAAADLVWDKGAPGMGDLASLYGRSTEPIAFGVFCDSPAAARGGLAARLRRGTVLRCDIARGAIGSDHPTQKPVALMRQIIESSTLLGDLVLDPFAGAGSTLVAAVVSGRQAIGIELEEKYCERAARRLRAARTLRLALEAM